MKKTDLNWIEKDYRDNEDEFPLMSFQGSKGKGRIIGFFDQENVAQLSGLIHFTTCHRRKTMATRLLLARR